MAFGTERKTWNIKKETFESIQFNRLRYGGSITWKCLFVLPVWMQTWWQTLGRNKRPYMWSVWEQDRMIGVAPLMVADGKVTFLGDPEVCDYFDFPVTPGKEKKFSEILLRQLRQDGITEIELFPVRRDSFALQEFAAELAKTGCRIATEQKDVALEMRLPNSWEGYLKALTGKQRHEVRRKLRRLQEAGRITFQGIEHPEEIKGEIETFLRLFTASRSEKASFMTDEMRSFFRLLADATAKERLLRLLFLELDSRPIAAVMCFDYDSRLYLYNNGYDPEFNFLSVGFLSKVMSIKHAIESGKKIYDFLKGAEEYKHRLGGREVPLFRCRINID